MAAPKHIKALFQHYLDNICTPDELDLLIDYFGTASEQDLRELITRGLFEEDRGNALTPNHKKNLQLIYENINQNITENEPEHIEITVDYKRSIWPRVAAVAAVLLVISSAIFFYTSYFTPRHPGVGQDFALPGKNLKPGGNKAYLTLANGKKLSLTDAANGALAKEAGVEISKTSDGRVVYAMTGAAKGGNVALNTIETPRGGQYQVRLPDGSKVYLNAASKLTYPISFNGRKERIVELIGEAYFEVAKDKEHPFRVRTIGQEVEVLGTHFNMNAYPDEDATKTSLLEGRVKVSKNGRSALLKPGQEAVIISGKSSISVRNADVQAAVAWKNGLFSFKRAELKVVMRQIARWYDVEIVYQGDIPKTAITGTIGRNLDASKALQIIENLGVSFKIEGKKIIINGK